MLITCRPRSAAFALLSLATALAGELPASVARADATDAGADDDAIVDMPRHLPRSPSATAREPATSSFSDPEDGDPNADFRGDWPLQLLGAVTTSVIVSAWAYDAADSGTAGLVLFLAGTPLISAGVVTMLSPERQGRSGTYSGAALGAFQGLLVGGAVALGMCLPLGFVALATYDDPITISATVSYTLVAATGSALVLGPAIGAVIGYRTSVTQHAATATVTPTVHRDGMGVAMLGTF